MPITRLAHRSVLLVAGEDRRPFLQGLISNDINKVAEGKAIWAAFLTPQGKFLCDLFIAERGEAFLVDVESGYRDDFQRKLMMFRLRSKITVTAPDLGVWAFWGEAAPAGGLSVADPRLAEMGGRIYAEQAPTASEAAFAEWDRLRITQGLPDGSRDMVQDHAIVLEDGFDELGGVDFQKGCYLGQELISRMKHRSLVKKRLLPVTIEGEAPPAGTPVTHGGAEAGEMRSSVGTDGLARLRLDAVRAGGVFECGGARLIPHVPGWMVLPD